MREDNLGGARQMILTAMDQYPQGFSISLKKMRLVYFLYRLGREMESQGRALDWGRINRQFTKDEELKIRPEDVERILKLIRNGDSSGGGNTLIRQSIGFMKEHYMEDLSLNRAAEYCHLNTSYFSRIFSQEIGSSFLDVLTDIRMENAMGLLAGTEHSVQEISERTGYPNTNYFYKVFKKTTGASVSEAREYVRLYGEIKWHSY